MCSWYKIKNFEDEQQDTVLQWCEFGLSLQYEFWNGLKLKYITVNLDYGLLVCGTSLVWYIGGNIL